MHKDYLHGCFGKGAWYDCVGRYLFLGNCSCVALLHAIHGDMQYLHSLHSYELYRRYDPKDGEGRATHGAVAKERKLYPTLASKQIPGSFQIGLPQAFNLQY